MKRAYSKDWCQGFCRTCGTSCADYCEDVHELKAENARLSASIGEVRETLALMAEGEGDDPLVYQQMAAHALSKLGDFI